MSPRPSIVRLVDPNQLNAYSYGGNNPTNMVDSGQGSPNEPPLPGQDQQANRCYEPWCYVKNIAIGAGYGATIFNTAGALSTALDLAAAAWEAGTSGASLLDVLAGEAGSIPAGQAAPDFLGQETGPAIPVPEGATGPYQTVNPGFQYNGGAGGNGLADNVTDVRIMDPNAQRPTGYVNYGSAQSNGGWQSVNPYTGQSVPQSSPWWHIPLH
jgi:hypothetical protein